MSVRTTIKLNRFELRQLLVHSLKFYSKNIKYLDGDNPYNFSFNEHQMHIYIKNVHSSGKNRNNEDECRIQVNNGKSLIRLLESKIPVVIIGYFADENVFTAWDPIRFKNDFTETFFDHTKKNTRSYYSRFSIQKSAKENGVSSYIDNNNQSVISFTPEHIGLYLENIDSIHRLGSLDKINKSDTKLKIDISDYLESPDYSLLTDDLPKIKNIAKKKSHLMALEYILHIDNNISLSEANYILKLILID